MTEQERAAELADEIERNGLAFTGDEPCDLVGSKDESVIVAALRAYAATPAATPIVTDDMLDALISALDVRAGYPHDHFATVYSESEKASARDWYRPALEAALKVKETADV